MGFKGDATARRRWDREAQRKRDQEIMRLYREAVRVISGPAAAPGLIIACLGIGDAFFPASAPPAPEAVAQLARAKGATNEQVARLQADNRELAEELARVKLESVDKVAALAAQVEQLTLTVAKLQPT